MANTAPLISSTGLGFAKDVVNAGLDGSYVKLCYLGDSIAGVSADALFGGLLRLANVEEFDGMEVTSSNMPFSYTAVNQGGASETVDSVDAGTDTITTATTHPWATGNPVQVTTTGVLPAGLAASTTYWVIDVDTTHMKLAASRSDAVGGTPVDITDAGSGTHTLTQRAYCASRSDREPGDATVAPGLAAQNYNPHDAFEWVFADAEIITPSNVTKNRLFSTAAGDTAEGQSSMYLPPFEALFHGGDWMTDHLNASDLNTITFRVYFYANTDGVDQNKIFLQASSGLTDLGSSAAFQTYAASAGIMSKTLTITGADAKTYSPGIDFAVRVTGDDELNLDGKNVIVCGAEVCKGREAGIGWLWIRRGGGKSSDFADTDKYSADCWDRLVEAGVTHVMICLDANGPTGTHEDNIANLVDAIRLKLPTCKFCFVAPYDLADALTTARTEAVYDYARANGHLFLNVQNYLPPYVALYSGWAVTYDDISAGWTLEAGDVILRSTSDYYSCHTTHSKTDWATDSGNFTQLTDEDLNYIKQNGADQRNLMLGDGTHPNRARGGIVLAGAIWSLIHIADKAATATGGGILGARR